MTDQAAIDRWIAENGVTKCPPAAVAPTEARIPRDAAAELAEHHEQLEQQRVAPNMRANMSASVREAQSKRRQAASPAVRRRAPCRQARSAERVMGLTGRTECCGTCGLCWGTRAPVAFVVH